MPHLTSGSSAAPPFLLCLLVAFPISSFLVIMAQYIPASSPCFATWFKTLSSIFCDLISSNNMFHLGLLIVNPLHLPSATLPSYINTLQDSIPSSWSVTHQLYHASYYGDAVDATRVFILITDSDSSTILPTCKDFDSSSPIPSFNTHTSSYVTNPTNTTSIHLSHHQSDVSYDHLDSKPRVVAAIAPTSTPLSHCAAPNFILDPGFPLMEPTSHSYSNNYFGQRAGICSGSHHTEMFGRSVTNIELLLCYSIPLPIIPTSLDSDYFTAHLDTLLPSSLPFGVTSSICDNIINSSNILN